jgi:hypothetical protein
VLANNDRAAGYARLLELIHPQGRRPFPGWHPRSGELGSPQLFVFRSCEHVIEQLKSASIARDGHDAGEAVDPKWRARTGTGTRTPRSATAACRDRLPRRSRRRNSRRTNCAG